MNLGIFETVCLRDSLAATYRAVADAGFTCVQGHLESTGIDPWAEDVPAALVQEMRDAAAQASVRIAAVSGTFNMAHPDPATRAAGLARFDHVATCAATLDAPFVTICTGTRDTSSMWHDHPDNGSTVAWRDMVACVTQALEIAERWGVVLLVEPEPANIASGAGKARQLLDEAGSDRLKIVLDPANIVLSDRTRSPEAVLEESFDLLGPDIVFAHAKDLTEDSQFCAAGKGIVPWPRYWELLEEIGYGGDVIYHTLTEADVPAALAVGPSLMPER
jgi:sugar phosphate isomerase/epimerase